SCRGRRIGGLASARKCTRSRSLAAQATGQRAEGSRQTSIAALCPPPPACSCWHDPCIRVCLHSAGSPLCQLTPVGRHPDAPRRLSMISKDQSPAEALARKANEAEHLREFIDRTTFAGDQREAAGELSAVDQHPADTADVTMQREVDYTIKGIVEDEVHQV